MLFTWIELDVLVRFVFFGLIHFFFVGHLDENKKHVRYQEGEKQEEASQKGLPLAFFSGDPRQELPIEETPQVDSCE